MYFTQCCWVLSGMSKATQDHVQYSGSINKVLFSIKITIPDIGLMSNKKKWNEIQFANFWKTFKVSVDANADL
jgi:hypothetical protein